MDLNAYLTMTNEQLSAQAAIVQERGEEVTLDAQLLWSERKADLIKENALLTLDLAPILLNISPKGLIKLLGIATVQELPELIDVILSGGDVQDWLYTHGLALQDEALRVIADVSDAIANDQTYAVNYREEYEQLQTQLQDQDPEVQRDIVSRLSPSATDMKYLASLATPSATRIQGRSHGVSLALQNPLLSENAKAFYQQHESITMPPSSNFKFGLRDVTQSVNVEHMGVDLTNAIGVSPLQLTWFLDDSNLLDQYIRKIVREALVQFTGGQYGL